MVLIVCDCCRTGRIHIGLITKVGIIQVVLFRFFSQLLSLLCFPLSASQSKSVLSHGFLEEFTRATTRGFI